MNPTSLKGILLAFLMKLASKCIEKQFAVQDPAKFRWENGTVDSTEHDNYAKCYFQGNIETDYSTSSFTSWIFTARYMLPVLGGLLSSAWLGYIRVLQIGGVIMLLSTVLMSVSVYLGLMCQSSPIIPITWLLLPLFFGLTQPNVLYGMFRWHRQCKACSIISALYITAAASGEWIGLLISNGMGAGDHCSLVFIALSILFIGMSLMLPKEPEGEAFEMPTQSRMNKYFQIFSGFIPLLIFLSDTRSAMYISEMKYFLNGTNYQETQSWLSPDWLKLLSQMLFSLLLALVAFISPRQLPMQPRVQFGLLMQFAVALGLLIFSTVGTSNPEATIAVYTMALVLGSVTEILVMVAAYNLGNDIAPSHSRAFVMGIMFTVWGLSNIASRLLVLTLLTVQPVPGQKPQFYVYHLSELVALIVCSIYLRFVALPLATHLIQTDDEGSDADSVYQPLLTNEDRSEM